MITLPNGLGGAEEIKKRFSVAQERRELWRSTLQEMYEYILPNRETFNYYSPGQRKSRHLYDNTGTEALNTFVSVVSASLTPENTEWVKLVAGSDISEQDEEEVNKSLEDATKVLFSQINVSNFYTESHLSNQDMALSTGAIMVEEGNGVDEPLLMFSAVPLSELYMEPTHLSDVKTAFRKRQIKGQEIEEFYPGAVLSDDLRRSIEQNKTKDFDVIDGCQVYNYSDKTYHQVVMINDEIIYHQEYGNSQPLIIYRWSKVKGETYGRGPADAAMADIRSLNKIKEFTLQNAALTINPPLLAATDGVFNPFTYSVQPGAQIPVSSVANPPIAKLDMGGDLRLTQFSMEEMKINIQKHFFADPLGGVEGPVRSATENMIRMQEMAKKRGASFGRLFTEMVRPLIVRCIDILQAAGRLPEMRVDGREIAIKLTSPIARTKDLEKVDNLFMFLEAMNGLPQEIAMLGASLESVPQFLQKALDLPEELARSKSEIETAKQQIMQQAAQQAEQVV